MKRKKKKKSESNSPLRTSQSTKQMKKNIRKEVSKFEVAKIKSNRDAKREETFTEYFNVKESQNNSRKPKLVKEIKFIRKSNLL